MKSKFFLQLIILSFCFFALREVSAQSMTQKNVKEWANARAVELIDALSEDNLAKKYQILDDLYNKYVDSKYIGRFVIGKYWGYMTPTEQTQYMQLFNRYALALYKSYPLNFKKENIDFKIYQVNVLSVQRAEARVVIHQNNLPEDDALQNIIVQLNIKDTPEGLKLEDIKIAEVSLIISYRNKFYQMIAASDGEMSWFLEDFADIVKSMEQQQQKSKNKQQENQFNEENKDIE